jgi:hypothetical protein
MHANRAANHNRLTSRPSMNGDTSDVKDALPLSPITPCTAWGASILHAFDVLQCFRGSAKVVPIMLRALNLRSPYCGLRSVVGSAVAVDLRFDP